MPRTNQKIMIPKRSKVPTTIFKVAKYLLTKESMTHKKLQKLCYYAYVKYLLTHRTPLFRNHFEAWIKGIVDPYLYAKYKKYNLSLIPQYTSGVSLPFYIQKCIDQVYVSYRHFTGDQLGRMQCLQEPWIRARGNTPSPYSSSNRIKDQDILDYHIRGGV